MLRLAILLVLLIGCGGGLVGPEGIDITGEWRGNVGGSPLVIQWEERENEAHYLDGSATWLGDPWSVGGQNYPDDRVTAYGRRQSGRYGPEGEFDLWATLIGSEVIEGWITYYGHGFETRYQIRLLRTPN